jgi:hypothetical protein
MGWVNIMKLSIRTKVSCGFLILAFALMVTDVCRLVRANADPVLSASAKHAGRF